MGCNSSSPAPADGSRAKQEVKPQPRDEKIEDNQVTIDMKEGGEVQKTEEEGRIYGMTSQDTSQEPEETPQASMSSDRWPQNFVEPEGLQCSVEDEGVTPEQHEPEPKVVENTAVEESQNVEESQTVTETETNDTNTQQNTTEAPSDQNETQETEVTPETGGASEEPAAESQPVEDSPPAEEEQPPSNEEIQTKEE
ncbi:110 kDa antigen-like isoform X9 [Lineus longissimus]|uniref:110 kDa antigen-like isoform X9 n=1 Tax=Lineus longissimus TaxID=88925 RepID=UPI00315C7275